MHSNLSYRGWFQQLLPTCLFIWPRLCHRPPSPPLPSCLSPIPIRNWGCVPRLASHAPRTVPGMGGGARLAARLRPSLHWHPINTHTCTRVHVHAHTHIRTLPWAGAAGSLDSAATMTGSNCLVVFRGWDNLSVDFQPKKVFGELTQNTLGLFNPLSPWTCRMLPDKASAPFITPSPHLDQYPAHQCTRHPPAA